MGQEIFQCFVPISELLDKKCCRLSYGNGSLYKMKELIFFFLLQRGLRARMKELILHNISLNLAINSHYKMIDSKLKNNIDIDYL
jgi:hypothetical protein